MQFLLLVFENQDTFPHVPDAEKRRLSDDCNTWFEELTRTGRGISMNRLQPAATATTMRAAPGGAFVVTDGPFAETKELLAGYVMFECRDRDEALALSRTFPAASITTVELRQIMPLEEESKRWRKS